MDRRGFITTLGASAGALAAGARAPFRPDDWSSVREQFALDPSVMHMAMFLLASHPRPVAEAITRHREALDRNPADYVHQHLLSSEPQIANRVAQYTGGMGRHIALTDSTTMGLGLLYGTLDVAEGHEILTTTHCHYSTQMAIEHRAARTGARWRAVDLYKDSTKVSVEEVVASVRREIKDNTRVFAATWVHSCDGVKLPIRAMADEIARINASRDEFDRVLFCVDGVHGFGNQGDQVQDLGCDFFVAGTHKWIFGPRGTGIVWGRPDAWKRAHPVIPSFGINYGVWLGLAPAAALHPSTLMTPGGFHSFEHRWALPEAFDFHAAIGPRRVHQRVTELNARLKEQLAEVRGLRLRTPHDPDLSAGITCFEIDGSGPDPIIARLHERGIIASSSPYRNPCARLAPSIVNSPEEVDRAVRELAAAI